jgi:hypothetical protein
MAGETVMLKGMVSLARWQWAQRLDRQGDRGFDR